MCLRPPKHPSWIYCGSAEPQDQAVNIYVTWSDKKGLIAHLPVLRYDGSKF